MDWHESFSTPEGRSTLDFPVYLKDHTNNLTQSSVTHLLSTLSNTTNNKNVSLETVFCQCLQDKTMIHFSVAELKDIKTTLSSLLGSRIIGKSKYQLVDSFNKKLFKSPDNELSSKYLPKLQNDMSKISKVLSGINKQIKVRLCL